MKLAELPELNQQVKDLTSILLRGSDQSDEPPLGFWAHLLPKLDQHQGFDVLRYAAGAPDFGPPLRLRSSAGFGDAHLLLLLWVPFTAAVCASSITSWLTHGWTGSCNADPSRHDFWGTFHTLYTHFSPSFMGLRGCFRQKCVLVGQESEQGVSVSLSFRHIRAHFLCTLQTSGTMREGQKRGETGGTTGLLYGQVKPRSCGIENKTWQK